MRWTTAGSRRIASYMALARGYVSVSLMLLAIQGLTFNERRDCMAQPLNLPLKTAGGAQVWTDHQWRDGWRVQHNVIAGHWRLVDADDVRRAWGSRAHCTEVLETMVPEHRFKSADGIAEGEHDDPPRVIILVHGLLRTHHCMKPLEQAFAEVGQQNVVRFSYASSRQSIEEHAVALRELIEELPEDTELSFVTHSMGGIVVRRLIGDLQRDGDPHGVIQRSRSMVMLGPPNQGAYIARVLASTGLYEVVTGPGGMELGPRWAEFEATLATPPFPFGIIAGDKSGTKVLRNPLLEGPSDLLVTVEEAKLEGAEFFEVVSVVHSLLMRDPDVMERVVQFVQSH